MPVAHRLSKKEAVRTGEEDIAEPLVRSLRDLIKVMFKILPCVSEWRSLEKMKLAEPCKFSTR